MNLTDALRELGLTKQEALLFLELCQSKGMTGYEAAKATGISRSNAYASLSSLTDKGFAYIVHDDPIRYMAMPKAELLANIRKKQASTLALIESSLSQTPRHCEPYVTVQGKDQVLLKMAWMVDNAKLRLYLSGSKSVVLALKPDLTKAYQRGLKVVLLTEEIHPDLPVIYYQTASPHNSIKLIVDTAHILAGSTDQALYSKNPTFVSIIRESLVYEIKLMENNMFPPSGK